MYNEDNQASHAPLDSWRGPARLEVFAGTVMTAIMAMIVLILLTAQPAHACSQTLAQGALAAEGITAVVETDNPCAAATSRSAISSYDQLRYVMENGHVTADVLQTMVATSNQDVIVTPRILLSAEDQLRYVVENGHVSVDALQNMLAANESRATAANRILISPADQLRYVMENGHVSADALATVSGVSSDLAITQPQDSNDTP